MLPKGSKKRAKRLPLWQRLWQWATAALTPDMVFVVLATVIVLAVMVTLVWPDVWLIVRRWN